MPKEERARTWLLEEGIYDRVAFARWLKSISQVESRHVSILAQAEVEAKTLIDVPKEFGDTTGQAAEIRQGKRIE